MTALKKMNLELEPTCVMSIGDSYENDILPARKLGMRAMRINEAWEQLGLKD